jgi:hypothetical protein
MMRKSTESSKLAYLRVLRMSPALPPSSPPCSVGGERVGDLGECGHGGQEDCGSEDGVRGRAWSTTILVVRVGWVAVASRIVRRCHAALSPETHFGVSGNAMTCKPS